MISMLHQAQLAAEKDGALHRDLYKWLGRLLVAVNLGIVPPRGIVWADIDADDIADNFTSGRGNRGSDYEGWAICDGNNGTPNLTDRFVRSNVAGSGGTGGTDDSAHTHSIDHDHESFTSGTPSATSQSGAGAPSSGSSLHTHAIDVPAYTGASGAASATDNRPAYYELVPLMRLEAA